MLDRLLLGLALFNRMFVLDKAFDNLAAQQGWRHGVRSRSLGGHFVYIEYEILRFRVSLLGRFLFLPSPHPR